MPSFAHRNLPLLLLHARESLFSHFRPLLHAHGVTEQQWRIIRVLVDDGPLEPRQIGHLCRFSSPSLAGILARMDAQGWVTRQRLEHDQRRVLVALTPQSEALAQRIAPAIEAVYTRVEQRLGQDFIQGFYAALDELISMAEATAEQDSGARDSGE